MPHDWCIKGHGACFPVCWKGNIKDPMLFMGNCSRFPLRGHRCKWVKDSRSDVKLHNHSKRTKNTHKNCLFDNIYLIINKSLSSPSGEMK